MTINPKELVGKLIAQHRKLQGDLKVVLDMLKDDKTFDSDSTLEYLINFKRDLLEHLELENEVFYPDYLKKKSLKGEDILSTKEFIGLMDGIGKEVMNFLERYNNPESIGMNRQVFSDELQKMQDTLNNRIETEEDGVYGIYLLI